MADRDDVRRIALALDGVSEDEGHFGFSRLVGGKRLGLAWAWRERVHPKRARVPSATVIAVRVADLAVKQAILETGEPFFTEPHYNGYPAVLVRLPGIGLRALRHLIEDAWRCRTPAESPRRRAAAKRRAARE
jgi:hypothetical protein